MHSIWTWLLATGLGTAPHWAALAMLLLLLAPEALKRLKTPRANTLVELTADLSALILRRFPGLGGLAAAVAKLVGSGAVALALVAGLGLSSGCSHGAAGGYQTLANVAAAVDGSEKTFESFDRDYQQLLVQRARTKAEAQASLRAYRAARARVNRAFSGAAAALASGRALVPLVEEGLKKPADLGAYLGQLFGALTEVQAALAAAGVFPALPTAQGGAK